MKVVKFFRISLGIFTVFSILQAHAKINASPADITLLKSALVKTSNPDALVPQALAQCEQIGAKSVQDCLRFAEERAKKSASGCSCCGSSAYDTLGVQWGFMCWPLCTNQSCSGNKK